MSLKARVAQVKEIKANEAVGYGLEFIAKAKTTIAVITIGYADGYPRNLGKGKGFVLINGQRAPIVGNICMDRLMVDISDISAVTSGDIATLIGRDGNEEISAYELALKSGTITNELLSRLGNRIERIVI